MTGGVGEGLVEIARSRLCQDQRALEPGLIRAAAPFFQIFRKGLNLGSADILTKGGALFNQCHQRIGGNRAGLACQGFQPRL